MAADGLTETRRAVHALRMDSKPLNEELGRVTGIHGERYDVKVTLGIGGAPRPVPPDATLALLRTAQEALVNAAKHAAGQGVAVHLDHGADGVRLTVVNDLAEGRDLANGHAGGGPPAPPARARPRRGRGGRAARRRPSPPRGGGPAAPPTPPPGAPRRAPRGRAASPAGTG